MTVSPTPLLAGIVVHWRDEAHLAELIAAWPLTDPRFELIVVDNSGTAAPAAPTTPQSLRFLKPGRNLGFAGGVNTGVSASRAPLVLLLNPDACPAPGALDALLAGFAAHPEAAGLAPRLLGPQGEPQTAWQLRSLPSLWDCLRQVLPWPAAADAGNPATAPPPAGAPIEQPAAAALALRRTALLAAGGLDERFHPAWFEDVDLAFRLRRRGAAILYWPSASFRHALGSTVPRLGYGNFLFIYHRNLERYLRKHHGRAAAWAARLLLIPSLALRLPLLAVRKPRRAADRRAAFSGLVQVLAGALTGWGRPRALAAPPETARGGAPWPTPATMPAQTPTPTPKPAQGHRR